MAQEDPFQVANFRDVCRFCLSAEQCVPLFIDSLVNDYLIDAIDLLLPKVDENDGLPNAVCEECYRVMADYAKFEATVIKTYNFLEAALAPLEDFVRTLPIDEDEVPCGTDEDGQQTFTNNDFGEVIVEDETPDVVEAFQEGSVTLQQPVSDGGKNAAAKKACPVCGKLVSQLSKHMPAHAAEKQYRCEYCDKQFTYDTSLRKHLNIHRNIRNYRCQYCEQSFCDRSSLRYHEAKHRGERNFFCEVCNNSFYTSSRLTQHLDLAHRERAYRCEWCGKMFHMKHHLYDHLRTHSNERPFICTVCEKAFKRPKNLNEHTKRHNSAE